ncbi:uncharacterized protein BT62DRAFT_677902 [Guyanagaster necrorhizus]|uniref:Uncharacterized protein n=1 Tax=Guyanagaster necrorhizus TaxID=856835 RepID=A0A9P8AVA5_9AGAR|nr:uncharacterized protein BT62DRAFT_677902 [Guyanagaster necrorhizus MCA 3950]KAG7449328.1 hypothetical protein BT62DRAFT_677902 [Guyanagaster necrorhizus MCA 3950]
MWTLRCSAAARTIENGRAFSVCCKQSGDRDSSIKSFRLMSAKFGSKITQKCCRVHMSKLNPDRLTHRRRKYRHFCQEGSPTSTPFCPRLLPTTLCQDSVIGRDKVARASRCDAIVTVIVLFPSSSTANRHPSLHPTNTTLRQLHEPSGDWKESQRHIHLRHSCSTLLAVDRYLCR